VILCSRSVKAGQKALTYEFTHKGHGGYTVDTANVVVKQLDLSSLSSVKAFATDFLATESRLDFLVLNAGIMALPRKKYTQEGFEMQIGVNHFGHFYLTQLLQAKLLSTPDTAGRVVVVSSVAHSFGRVDTSDLHYKNGEIFFLFFLSVSHSPLLLRYSTNVITNASFFTIAIVHSFIYLHPSL
jgi:NAD(P)-dependent dehydrogenase (short-subunit alcohol dehydrogenase family)